MAEAKSDRVNEILFEVLERLNKETGELTGLELRSHAHAMCEVAKVIRSRTNMQSWLCDGDNLKSCDTRDSL